VGPQFLVGPTCGGASVVSATFPGTTGPIPTTSLVEFSLQASGLGSSLWDVDLFTAFTHTASQDLDVVLISPAGTQVVITTDNGGLNDDVFHGTLWDDSVNDPVTDRVFTNLVVATPLSPEGRLQAFRGENPNGTWRLRVQDDAASNTGALASWSLRFTSLASAPASTTTTVSRTPALALADNALTSDTVVVTGASGTLSKVVLYTEIRHTYCADLDIRLISPSGTSVVVTTDGGGSFDDVFRGTSFDPDALLPVTDALFTNLVAVPLVAPEGSFDVFSGENPNGTWKLAITDDLATNVGTLDRWDLELTTVTMPSMPPAVLIAGAGGAIPEYGPGAPTPFTAQVSGVSGYLWDVDLTTFFVHGACADLDITLTSPSGRTIVISTDNGFTGGVFNGTLWDDNANDPATDRFYTTNVVATPLSPEGRLSAFRGDVANGMWTLTVADDSPAVAGSLAGWSLTLATVPAAPTVASTTFSRTPNLPIPDYANGTLGVVTDTLAVSGLGNAIAKLKLYVEVPHSWSDDLELFLTSPAGTRVAVQTDCSGNFDDVFNGTLFDPASTLAPSDYVYQDFVVVPLLAPEGSFDNFLGQNPNGNWVLEARDDHALDVGTLVRWDLIVETCAVAVPQIYCAPLPPGSSSGCIPQLSAPANPNLAHSGTCVLTLSQVEGQRAGIFFYGINGTQQQSWCNSQGQSFLCVRPPTQRTLSSNSGGTPGTCSGSFTLDWNAFQLANPTALGNPFGIGSTVEVQGWFRDPTACKTTFLTPAATLTYQP
jgi:subtilisin-like proprotein convertase family protein